MIFNYNIADCIHTSASFGHNTYYNICSGVQSVVPWGSLDWTFFSTLAAMAVAIAIAATLGIVATIFDW